MTVFPCNRLINFLFLFLSLFFFSCRTTNKVTKSSSLEEIFSTVQHHARSYSTMNAEGTMTMENEENSFNLSFELTYKNNDSMLLKLFGPFGISVGVLQLTRDSFQLYNAQEKRLIVASLHDKAFEALLHFSADFPTILKIFFDENFSEPQSNMLTLSTNEDEIVLSHSTEKFWFDNVEQTIERYEKRNDANEILLEKTMKRFSFINETRFPFWIRTAFPKENRTITISYSNVEFDNPVQCSLTVPKNVEIIRR